MRRRPFARPSGFERRGPPAGALPEVPAEPGTIVEDRSSGFSGEVVGTEDGAVVLRDWKGRERTFPLGPGFLVDDQPVTLVAVPPAGSQRPSGPSRTASGSVAGPRQSARVASPHRIYVEGVHDAELLEKVWGDDLREAAIAVEPLGGADDLTEAVRRFAPGPERRLGVLLDHLVDGSKESRIAARSARAHVLITGHPYVDVWQGVRPHAVGLRAWPDVPRDREWKAGICAALGESEPAALWRRLLRSVDSYADLEPELVGAVERLLDFLVDVPQD